MSDIYDRIKKACIALNNEACLGQTREISDGEYCTMHRLSLEFVYPDTGQVMGTDLAPVLASRMIRADKKIVLYLGPISELLSIKIEHDKIVDPSNADLLILAARVMFRELWWYNKGVESHDTPLTHLQSQESMAAFKSGFTQARREIIRDGN